MALQFSMSFSNDEVDELMDEYDTNSISELQSEVKPDMKDAVLNR